MKLINDGLKIRTKDIAFLTYTLENGAPQYKAFERIQTNDGDMYADIVNCAYYKLTANLSDENKRVLENFKLINFYNKKNICDELDCIDTNSFVFYKPGRKYTSNGLYYTTNEELVFNIMQDASNCFSANDFAKFKQKLNIDETFDNLSGHFVSDVKIKNLISSFNDCSVKSHSKDYQNFDGLGLA